MSIYSLAFRYNVPQLTFFDAVNPNVDPSPSFDIELNEEDKDSDIDHPVIEKESRKDNGDKEDS